LLEFDGYASDFTSVLFPLGFASVGDKILMQLMLSRHLTTNACEPGLMEINSVARIKLRTPYTDF
jgi:hypothetical protein